MTDSQVLAAMAHPLRRRLMDVLAVDGPATVSTLAERTDQAVGNISHHMKVLAAAELVEQAPELANDRRERWWRKRSGQVRFAVSDFADDAAATVIAEAAESLNLERHIAVMRAWMAGREDCSPQWRSAAFSSDSWLRLSPAELAEFSEELIALMVRWARRDIPDDGQQREPVFVFGYGVPAKP
ncbi:helix-turn-helix domain-containing protein [Kutzneria sp. NPDC051319]|uniref:ArsR/SmtB family transcription factor n=1 Tax=Kutzneria sp. NPDC051319 TaxID=3155047 RepID=UPI003441C2AA